MKKRTLKFIRKVDDVVWRVKRGDRRRVLLDGESAMHFAMFETLYGALNLDERIAVRLTSSWEGGLKVELEALARFLAGAERRFVPYSRAKWKKWDVYLTSCFDVAWLARNAAWIDIFHGVGEKWIEDGSRLYMCHPLAKRYDYLLCPNERVAGQYRAHPQFLKKAESVVVNGLPKSDLLVWLNEQELQRALKMALGLDPDRPLLLFAPTFGPGGLLHKLGRQVVETIAGLDAGLVVKLHACSYLPDPSCNEGIDWRTWMNSASEKFGFRHVPDASLPGLMLAADMMISDFGSAPVEFCLLDRPLLFYQSDEQRRRMGGDGFQFDALSKAAHVFQSTDQLRRRLSSLLEGKGESEDEPRGREHVRRTFFSHSGWATERALQLIYDVLQLDMPDSLIDRYRAHCTRQAKTNPSKFLGL